MGPAGITSHFNGQRIYFCTTNNDVVEMLVQNATVQAGKGFDYTILFFSRDLPPALPGDHAPLGDPGDHAARAGGRSGNEMRAATHQWRGGPKAADEGLDHRVRKTTDPKTR